MDIWGSFVDFEFLCGDIQAVNRIEQRKESVAARNESGMMQMIYRYKYDDLWPCTPTEMEMARVAAVPNLAKGTSKGKSAATSRHPLASLPSAVKENVDTSHFVRPNFSQMIAYRPETMSRQGNPLPPPNCRRGVTPRMFQLELSSVHLGDPLYDVMTPALLTLLSSLPPAEVYISTKSPLVDLDKLTKLLIDKELPKGLSAKIAAGSKRKYSEMIKGDNDDRLDESGHGPVSKPPSHDIYRERQAAKLAKSIQYNV
mgnify:CR=1 FL=1|tara:strand:- start:767 stop:1537 length:771 start_codon:yes stop_codon:yes gene_type:complete